ncbi:MAG TPA: hypothetical protein PKE26_07905 [Kiritimatiellia bacterium]|nr:hypothetical protein [Kiritimatiellia bacterium]HMO99016.1 hypothetical protein [Kiritimatiellia bacterium]HMP95903.1 hypothetical protein [Kiritimatiellia bacterium]
MNTTRTKWEIPVAAALEAVSGWPEAREAAVRASPRKQRAARSAMEQSELWPARPVAVVADAAPAEVAPSRAAFYPLPEAPLPAPEVKPLRPAVARAAKAMVRPAASVASRRAPGQPSQMIARFLNVNGAIEGMRSGAIRFDLPGRGLSKTLRLWKGSPEVNEVVPVYY